MYNVFYSPLNSKCKQFQNAETQKYLWIYNNPQANIKLHSFAYYYQFSRIIHD